MTTTTTEQQEAPPPSEAQGPVMYVVTALLGQDDWTSPQIVGVYTSQEKAIQSGRDFFEEHAKTYSNGKFDKNVDDLEGQQDFSEHLVLRNSCPYKRIFAEKFDKGIESVLVAINAIRCGTGDNNTSTGGASFPVVQPVPLLRQWKPGETPFKDPEEHQTVQDETCENNNIVEQGDSDSKLEQTVHVLMDVLLAIGEGPDQDPGLIGVFFAKDVALQAAKVHFDAVKGWRDFYPNITWTDNTATINERGQLLALESDGNIFHSIAMDTFVLDNDYLEPTDCPREQLDFNGCDGIYHQPYICDLKESCASCTREKGGYSFCRQERAKGDLRVCNECLKGMTRLCSSCKIEQQYCLYLHDEWYKDDTDRMCSKCLEKMTRECSQCKAEKKFLCYQHQEWEKDQNGRTCDECLEKKTIRRCSVCNHKKGEKNFSLIEWSNPDQDRTCKKCSMKVKHKKHSEKNTSKTKTCSVCNVTKDKKSFFRKQWDETDDQDRTCRECLETMKACSICNVHKNRFSFSEEEFNKGPDETRQCNKCMFPKIRHEKSTPSTPSSSLLSTKRAAAASVTAEKEEDKSNKKPKLLNKQCTACKEDKLRDDFSKTQWSKSTGRRCKLCIESSQKK